MKQEIFYTDWTFKSDDIINQFPDLVECIEIDLEKIKLYSEEEKELCCKNVFDVILDGILKESLWKSFIFFMQNMDNGH